MTSPYRMPARMPAIIPAAERTVARFYPDPPQKVALDALVELRPLMDEMHALMQLPGKGGSRLVEVMMEIKHRTAKMEEPRFGGVVLSAYLSMVTVCEANRASSSFWMARFARAKGQKGYAYAEMLSRIRKLGRNPVPCAVFLTRVAPRDLDPGDNYSSAFKHVRDGIAKALGVDDRDPRVEWYYGAPKRGRPNECAVLVEIIERAKPRRGGE